MFLISADGSDFFKFSPFGKFVFLGSNVNVNNIKYFVNLFFHGFIFIINTIQDFFYCKFWSFCMLLADVIYFVMYK